jgi:hypothetical protein
LAGFIRGRRRGEGASSLPLSWPDLGQGLAVRPPCGYMEAERAGQPAARGRGLDLVRVARTPEQRSSVEKVCFWPSIIIQKCVLVMGLTGVLGARPTGRSYTCKHVFVIIGTLYVKRGCVLRQIYFL